MTAPLICLVKGHSWERGVINNGARCDICSARLCDYGDCMRAVVDDWHCAEHRDLLR